MKLQRLNNWIWGGAGGFLVGAVPALAQDTGAAPIIVTGERLNRTLAETASSVTVITATDLEQRPDLARLDSILQTIPNVTLGSGGLGPTIRGQDTTGVLRDLPAFLGGNRPRTTLIVDGRPVTYNEFVFGAQPLWDVARVEVFRSPQTTTLGRNSISGAIIVETEQAEDVFGASARAFVGAYDTLQLSASVTGPILPDQITFRISGDRHRSVTSSELSGGEQTIDPNEDRYDHVRARMLFDLAHIDPLKLEVTYSHLQTQAVQIEGVREPFRERRDPFARYGVFRTNIDSVTFRPEWQFDETTSIRGVASVGWGEIHRFAPPGLGEADTSSRDRTFELSFRHQGRDSGMIVGAAYSRVNQTQWIDVTTVRLGTGSFADQQTSFGLFGEAIISPLDNVSVTVGGRFQTDRQVREGMLLTPAGSRSLDYDGEFSWLLPKISLSFEPFEGLTTGILVQKAANPGGTTLLADTGEQDRFAPESLWDFELFARGEAASGSLHYQANLFYYDMTDAQRSVTRTIQTPGGPFYLVEIGNVPKAWSAGAELQFGWRVTDALDISGSIGVLDARISEVVDDDDPLLGNEFQRSPHMTGSMAASWQADKHLSFHVSLSVRSGYYDDDLNTPSLRIDGTSVLDVRASWQHGPIRLIAYARNAFDRFYLTSLSETGLATAGDPREIGVGVEGRF
ncbi:TonB-dependent receptor [Aurantiacibacter hainanensis]|uniref:TonB-dependent receptor n=1 Tax=Aurantiacibacter hainanensis TaxID=3076114 RepID=UPI0030C77793